MLGNRKIKSLQYMFRCLGIIIDNLSFMYNNNLNIIQNISIPDVNLKKKHVIIFFIFAVRVAFEILLIYFGYSRT